MNWFLMFNALYYLFGATMYMGTMWTLKNFLYPTWRVLTPDNVYDHFGVPTLRATKFFTFVVPPMFLSAIIMIVDEYRHLLILAPIGVLLGVAFLTYVGQVLIIPINKKIRGGQYQGQDELRALLVRWMALNDLRFYGSTVTWLVIVYYLVMKGHLVEAFR
jgi:hypothetical protein